MEFKTTISTITDKDNIIRGEKLSVLVEQGSFGDAVFLLLAKRKPTTTESRIFSALLTSVIDHGMGTTSSMTSRFVMSAGNPLSAAVGAGVLALGDRHGGAIEHAMAQFQSFLQQPTQLESAIAAMLNKQQVVYGYGHSVYKDADPRVTQILELCAKLGYASKYADLAKQVELILEKKKGKKLCLNIDGLIAALLLEMGFSPVAGRGFFIIARTPGLVAQAIEEKENEKSIRRIEEKDIHYEGKQ